MTAGENALIIGAGPGLGRALARRCAAEGMGVAVAARRKNALEAWARAEPGPVLPFACDVTRADDVDQLFEHVEGAIGPLSLVVFNASRFTRGSILEQDPSAFEEAVRVGCVGGFLVGQAAARRLVPRGQGTILFTGATASLRGSSGFSAFAAQKFGLRAVAQSMARELGPRGIHVAHVVIDGVIGSESGDGVTTPHGLLPSAIADTYLAIHRQHPSAWTQEIDLRPSSEVF